MSALGRLSQRDQYIVLGVLILLLCVVFYMYFIRPLRVEVDSLQAEISTLELQIQQGQALRVRLEKLKQAVDAEQAHLNQLRRILPEKKETAQIIRQIQQLAVDSNLRIRSFTPRATVNNVFYEDWPILIALDGTYDSLGHFFQEISKFERIINVEDISIQALDEPARNRTLSATCTATTFVYIEDAEQASQQQEGEGK